MFLKLCKFELKNSYRSFLFMYAVILLLSIFISPSSMRMPEFTAMLIFIYSVAMVALIIMAFVNVIRNYSNSMFSKNAYLTHTLPVTSWQLLLVKVVGGLLWLVLSSLIIILSIFIIAARDAGVNLFDVPYVFSSFFQLFDGATVFLSCLSLLLSTVYSVTLFYFIMTFVHTKFVPRFKVPVAIILFIAISWIVSVLGDLISGPGFAFSFSYSYTGINEYSNFSTALSQSSIIAGSVSLVLSLVLFFGNVYLLNKRLEVE